MCERRISLPRIGIACEGLRARRCAASARPAARATDKLIDFAEPYGIRLDNIGDQFKPEPPSNPLVLRDYASGKGVNRERGAIIRDYKRMAACRAGPPCKEKPRLARGWS
jgi:hypothetical protein